MFKNCYTYNKPGEDVTVMCQTLEKAYLVKMKGMPSSEMEMTGLNSPAVKKPSAASGTPNRPGLTLGGTVKKPSGLPPGGPAGGPRPGSAASSLASPASSDGTPTKG